jgi:hypothetical protein
MRPPAAASDDRLSPNGLDSRALFCHSAAREITINWRLRLSGDLERMGS